MIGILAEGLFGLTVGAISIADDLTGGKVGDAIVVGAVGTLVAGVAVAEAAKPDAAEVAKHSGSKLDNGPVLPFSARGVIFAGLLDKRVKIKSREYTYNDSYFGKSVEATGTIINVKFEKEKYCTRGNPEIYEYILIRTEYHSTKLYRVDDTDILEILPNEKD